MCGKMAEELLSLKWNNHQAHFVDILTFLREQEIFVDATLACGGKLYAAHKFVLSTCSDYFKQMFTKNPSKHPIVFMKDVSTRDLEALLDFMYNGEVNVPQSSLGSLIKTAEGLQIKGLAVPDDPPVKRDRDKRDSKPQEPLSPPPKRPRMRENSPVHSLPSRSLAQSSYTPTPSSSINRPRSPRPRSPLPPSNTSSGASQPPVEATLDEDSRTSIQSGVSGLSEHNSSTTPSLSSKIGSSSQQIQSNTGDTNFRLEHRDAEDPSPGPSGIQKPQSKEEPLEIKQEDVVDLGEDDDGDWGAEGDAGGGDSSMGSENPPSFPDVVLPHGSDAMQPTGDPAMGHVGWGLADNLIGIWHGVIQQQQHQQQQFQPHQQVRNQHSEDPRPYACSFCDRRFKRSDHQRQHERLHTGEKPYVCPVCGARFAQHSGLHYHKLNICPKEQGSRAAPPQPLPDKPSEVEQPHTCTDCGAKFAQQNDLFSHKLLGCKEESQFKADPLGDT